MITSPFVRLWLGVLALLVCGAGAAQAQPNLTPTSLPDGEVTVPYLQSLTANDFLPLVCCTWSQAGLPTGLSLNGNGTSATISGTPTTATPSITFTITADDGLSRIDKQYTIAILQAPSISPSALPSGEEGVSYAPTLTASGGTNGGFTWSKAGALPSGVTFTPGGSTASFSGVPGAGTAGNYPITVSVTDSAGGSSGAVAYTIVIVPPPSVSTSSLPAGEATVPYSLTSLMATGGTPPYTWASGALPAGLTLAVNGTLSGTPSAAASGGITFTVTDANLQSASASIALNIIAAPVVPAASLPDGEVTISYPMQTLSASGGSSATYTWSISSGALPGGIILNPSNGQLTGTPTAAGTFNFTAKATDTALGFGTQAFSIHIIAPPAVAAAVLPNGEVTVAYPLQTLTASGGASGGYTWSISVGALPGGISINPSNGQLTGTPTAAGTFNVTAKATDTAGGFGTQGFTITVIAAPSITTNSPLPSGTVNQAYTPTPLAAINGTGSYTWALSPASTALPNGISLSPGGLVSGTPTSSGDFTPTVRVTDTAGAHGDKQFTISIAVGLVITTAPTLPGGTLGVAYSQGLAAAGGTQPYTWSVISGQLPSGVTLAGNGTLSGTPGSAGGFDFTAQVTDSNSASTTKLFHLQISGSLSITSPPTLPGGAVGVAYSQTLTASGGTQPYTWSVTIGSLPGGLLLNAGTGAITGTPTATGTFNFTVQVADNASVKASQAFSIQISSVTITNSPTLPSGAVGVAYSQTLTASGGMAPYTWSITAGALPGGLQLSSGGGISGTPTATGTFVFTVQAADSAAVKATKQFSITVVSGLTITNAPTLPAGVSGVSYSQSLAAVGGTTPYTWSIIAGSLPNGLSLNSSNGAITGTPSSNGNFNFTVQVSDTASVKATKAFSVTIAPLPEMSVTGLTGTAQAGQQLNFDVRLASGYSVPITGRITLSFQPDAVAPADDPAIQFSTGGRTLNFTIPANATRAVFPASQVSLGTGTVSGTIGMAFSLEAGGANLPTTGLDRSITIARSAPVIKSVDFIKSGTTFQVRVVGYSTPRELTQVHLRFTAAAGASLQTLDVMVPLSSVAGPFFASSGSAQFGGQFELLLPFTASQGSASAIGSVTVDLSSNTGTSQPVSANY